MDRRRTEDSRQVRRRNRENDDIIKVSNFDYSDLIEKYKLSLVGRMFHRDGRSVDALLTHMSEPPIWDVEGRVRDKKTFTFQFDLYKEE